jgi:hypothetical protein
MPGIVNAGAILLRLDLAIQIDGHALELGDHALDLRDFPTPLVDLEFLEADERFA